MPTTADELRTVALEQFGTSGYLATSLQHIADAAGVSKASILYHFASKEVLLEAALTPAIDALDLLVAQLEAMPFDTASRREFVPVFVDFLLEHRLAVHVFVNQVLSLAEMPIVQRADALVQRIAVRFETGTDDEEERVRFGIALAGAAYLLAQGLHWKQSALPENHDIRPILLRVLAELIDPSSRKG